MKNKYNGIIETIARGVLIDRDHLLVCRQRDVPLLFLPGGHVEFGESARRALEREWQEELAEEVRAGDFLGAVEHGYVQQGEPHAEINLVFRVTGSRAHFPEIPEVAEPHLVFEWIALDTLECSGLEPAPLCTCLPAWLSGAQADRFGSSIHDRFDSET